MKKKMKNILIFITTNLMFFSCFAQTDRKVFVADSITKEPVEYACVVFADTVGGTYSNNKGLFYIPENIKYVEISSIGYNTKVIVLQKNNDTVFLSPQIYEISEAKIIPVKQKRKSVELGYAKEKAKHFLGFLAGGEIAVYIPLIENENAYRLIKQVIVRGKTDIVKEIKINKITYNVNKTDYTSVFKINFYRATENKEIGELMNTEDIVFTSDVLKNKTKLDVSKYNIYMPENGIFVAIEWVGTINPETEEIITILKTGIFSTVSVSYEIPNTIVYEKRKFSSSNQVWQRVNKDSKENNIYTPLFSIVLE
jgi:hypothetical protein